MNIIGIDAGGSKTQVVYGSEDAFNRRAIHECRKLTLGPGNYRQIGSNGIRLLTQDIIRQLDLSDPHHTGVIAGFAGAGTSDSEEEITKIFQGMGFSSARLLITSDVSLLLRALQNHGILLIAGTGSICMGRRDGRDDSTVRAGGWGYRLRDAGSGYYLGIRAIEALLRIEDGIVAGPWPTLLDERLKTYFGIESLADITNVLYAEQRDNLSTQEQVAGLSKIVLDTAHQGGAVARRIVEDAVTALAEYIQAVYNRLDRKTTLVGLYGGLFRDPCAEPCLIEPLKSHDLLADLNLQFELLGIHEADRDPLIDAVRFTIKQWAEQ